MGMTLNVESEIVAEINRLEGRLAGLRQALDLIRNNHPVKHGDGGNFAQELHDAIKEHNVRKVSPTRLIRNVIAHFNGTFTPSDIVAALDAKNCKLPRTRITTILHRLAVDRAEILIEQNGKGGIEPIYRKIINISEPKPKGGTG